MSVEMRNSCGRSVSPRLTLLGVSLLHLKIAWVVLEPGSDGAHPSDRAARVGVSRCAEQARVVG